MDGMRRGSRSNPCLPGAGSGGRGRETGRRQAPAPGDAPPYCGSLSSMPFTYQFMPSRVPSSRRSPSPTAMDPSCL